MTLSGKDDLRHLTANLDAKRLVRLTADLLVVWGHSEVRIVDGPGDGGRDVHAVAADGGKVLAQCKFHEDPTKTCSSAELSELPMALIKLGYKRGVFVTNARISPQGKREYLDNYPDLKLVFVDGDQLVRVVLQVSLLRALWFDGSELGSVTTVAAIPVLIREHEADASIVPSRWDSAPDPAPLLNDLSHRFPGLVFHVSEAHPDPSLFEPYRYPEPFTAEEGMMPFLRATMVSVRGNVLLADIVELGRNIAEAFGTFLGDQWQRFTVRVGAPRLTPLAGDQGGLPVEVHTDAASFVTTAEARCLPESEFFGLGDCGWTALSDARTTEAAFIRVFHPDLNVLTTYEIEGRPSAAGLALMRAQNESTAAGWAASVHALVPNYEVWEHPIPEPDEKIVWPWDGRLICAWFHGSLVSEVVVPRTINGRAHPFNRLVKDRTRELQRIRDYLAGLDSAKSLTSDEALHMVGALGVRIFLDLAKTTTRTAEATHYPDRLPSPVLPASRRLEVLTAWRLTDPKQVDESAMAAVAGRSMEDVQPTFTVDTDHLVGTWPVPNSMLLDAPTPSLLRQLADRQQAWVREVEQTMAAMGVQAERATRDYWEDRHNLRLGLDPAASAKVFSWGATEDGGWAPQIAGSAFDPSEPQPPLPEGMSEEMAKIFGRTPPTDD